MIQEEVSALKQEMLRIPCYCETIPLVVAVGFVSRVYLVCKRHKSLRQEISSKCFLHLYHERLCFQPKGDLFIALFRITLTRQDALETG